MNDVLLHGYIAWLMYHSMSDVSLHGYIAWMMCYCMVTFHGLGDMMT